jgi:hypothetical protein
LHPESAQPDSLEISQYQWKRKFSTTTQNSPESFDQIKKSSPDCSDCASNLSTKRDQKLRDKLQVNSASEQKATVKAETLARMFNGKLLQPATSTGKQATFKFQCQNGHVFTKTSQELPTLGRKQSIQTSASGSFSHLSDQDESFDDIWCPKCVAFYRQCQAIAKQHKHLMLGELYGKIQFKCPQLGHLIKISYSRRLNNQPLQCAQCHKLERERQKLAQRQQEAEQQSYFAKMQEQCFENASRAMHEELKNQDSFREEHQEEDCAQVELQVNRKAQNEAEEFMRKLGNCAENLQMEQAYLVYKFLFISEELMVKGLMGMPQPRQSQWFRSVAKCLHPDKNRHPEAKAAFQRVQSAMESVKAMIPAQCSSAPSPRSPHDGPAAFANFFF